mgnify:CR=1 FL=1
MSSEVAALSRVHDRVLATDNDKLPHLLEKLLPGLLPLANKDELRPQVLVIISNLVRRIKVLRTPLPCSVLLGKLVTPEMMPFTCNIALTLLDIALPHESPDSLRGQQCAAAVLAAMALFYPSAVSPAVSPAESVSESVSVSAAPVNKGSKVFTLQLKALVSYALELLPHVPTAVTASCSSTLLLPLHTCASSSRDRDRDRDRGTRSPPPPCHHLELLWDFLLDLSLAAAPLVKDTLGSVQPGLSQQRVLRLCHRTRPAPGSGPGSAGSSGLDSAAAPSSAWFLPQLREVIRLTPILWPDILTLDL